MEFRDPKPGTFEQVRDRPIAIAAYCDPVPDRVQAVLPPGNRGIAR